jgi:regulator of protease activity HflC (stomatin/prohibitin superfamily)
MIKIVLTIVLIAVIILLLSLTVRIVPQANAYIVERLGRYHKTLQPGFHMLLPLIDRVSRKVAMMEQVVDFAPQPVITKDNVTMRIDTVLYYRVIDAKLYAYGVNNPLVAEGKKQAAILNAQGEKESAILRAEAEKQAAILRAEAAREAAIREAEGHGKAIVLIQEANADGIEALNRKKPSAEVLQLKRLEAFAKAAGGDVYDVSRWQRSDGLDAAPTMVQSVRADWERKNEEPEAAAHGDVGYMGAFRANREQQKYQVRIRE